MFPYYSNYMNILLFSNPKAYAWVRGISEYPNLQGMVLFYDTGKGTIVSADFKGLPTEYNIDNDQIENEHQSLKYECTNPFGNIFAFHIHEGENCTGTVEDPLKDTGMHLNPDRCYHPYHMGDMPPLFSNGKGSNDGKAWFAFYTERFHIWDIIGKTVVVHRGVDDFTSQPSGNAGKKIACGIIRRELHQ